jgi:hypothetical protein
VWGANVSGQTSRTSWLAATATTTRSSSSPGARSAHLIEPRRDCRTGEGDAQRPAAGPHCPAARIEASPTRTRCQIPTWRRDRGTAGPRASHAPATRHSTGTSQLGPRARAGPRDPASLLRCALDRQRHVPAGTFEHNRSTGIPLPRHAALDRQRHVPPVPPDSFVEHKHVARHDLRPSRDASTSALSLGRGASLWSVPTIVFQTSSRVRKGMPRLPRIPGCRSLIQ